MREIVVILIKRWEERARGTEQDTRALCLITLYCLRQYYKYLTGGKKEQQNEKKD